MTSKPKPTATSKKRPQPEKKPAKVVAKKSGTSHASGAADATRALSALTGDEVVLLLSSGPLAGLPDSLPPIFDRLYGGAAAV